MTDTGVHLIQLSSEFIKASIHALKLHHDYSRVTPPTEEEGADVDGVEEARGVAVSVRGRFGRSWALLCLTDASLMAPMIEK